VVLPGIVLYAGGIVGAVELGGQVQRSALRRGHRLFLLVWTATAAVAVALGARFFGHYFLQVELPLALVAAIPVTRWTRRGPVAVGALLLAPAALFFVIAWSPALAARLFSGDDPDWRLIGQTAAAETAPADRIWVWGNVPQIYYAADRRQG